MNECSVFNDAYVLSETEEWIWFASYVTEIVFSVLKTPSHSPPLQLTTNYANTVRT